MIVGIFLEEQLYFPLALQDYEQTGNKIIEILLLERLFMPNIHPLSIIFTQTKTAKKVH